jgi:hypothetical protein
MVISQPVRLARLAALGTYILGHILFATLGSEVPDEVVLYSS